MFESGVVVDDGVDRFSLRYPSLDGVEEADEILMAVALHVVSDDGVVEHVPAPLQSNAHAYSGITGRRCWHSAGRLPPRNLLGH